uniref:Uncharacterized protein n=1 Tax=Rhizophagus irregularis (strain DAOM 181602 / DAOM 197198 / MUCL 43194) TaxID=747089 RepID=U9T3N2_RHIID
MIFKIIHLLSLLVKPTFPISEADLYFLLYTIVAQFSISFAVDQAKKTKYSQCKGRLPLPPPKKNV